MLLQQLSRRDRLTYGLAAVAVVVVVAVNLVLWLRSDAASSGPGLAASWQTYGGSASYRHSPCGIGACPETKVVVLQDGTYTVTTLFHTDNGNASGRLSPAQTAQLAQARSHPDLPAGAPVDCGSYLFTPHVKIIVVTAAGSTSTLDTCLADVPASNPLVELLEGLAASGAQAS